MEKLWNRFRDEESGEDLIEYGLLAAFVAAIATTVLLADVGGMKTALKAAFDKAKKALQPTP